MMTDTRALLLTGAYGTGKSTVAAEIADVLEAREVPYAAIDLDWLCWSNVPGSGHDQHDILARNLVAMTATYRRAGVHRIVLAGSIQDSVTLDAIRDAVGMPLQVIRLTAPLNVIEARLGASPASGRADDLARAREWLIAGTGEGLEDAILENVGPVRATALRALELAQW